MAITIQFNANDDPKVLESLLALFREAGVTVQVVAKPKTKKLDQQRKPKNNGLAERLHGVLKLPPGFDYKSALSENLLKKHTAHG
jgi:uncharacterized protein YecE (DUF72 family)